jgi:hypothetical protein
MCLEGASGAGAELMAAIPDADLRAHFVWVAMLPSDSEQAAVAASERFAEPRATHYWDADRHLARHMSPVLGIDSRAEAAVGDVKEFAWDVYLAYRRGNTDIAAPDFWMHQLAVPHAPTLDASEWRRRVEALL